MLSDWDGSRNECRKHNGDLVVFHNKEEESYFLNGPFYGYWVGYKQKKRKGEFIIFSHPYPYPFLIPTHYNLYLTPFTLPISRPFYTHFVQNRSFVFSGSGYTLSQRGPWTSWDEKDFDDNFDGSDYCGKMPSRKRRRKRSLNPMPCKGNGFTICQQRKQGN